jgi:Bacteriophage lambda head decoration protein D
MANVYPPYNDGHGRALFEQLDTYLQNHLISGVTPELLAPIAIKQKASTELAQFTVVGLDSNGEVVIATYNANPANAIKPIGVLAHASTAGASGTVNAQIFFSGCFDPTFLVWDSTFNTDALKAAAFRGSPTPTQIVIRKKF